MKQTIEIQTMKMVRRIRKDLAAQLAGKSAAEEMDFFNRAGVRARKRGERLRSARKLSRASEQDRQPTAQKTRGG